MGPSAIFWGQRRNSVVLTLHINFFLFDTNLRTYQCVCAKDMGSRPFTKLRVWRL